MTIIRDMPAEQYHAVHALSASGLRRLRQSPLHFWSAQLDPTRQPSEPTPAMRNGTLVHCLVLEPSTTADRHIIRPDDLDARTKAGKDWLAAVPQGRIVVTADELRAAERQAASILALPDVAALLAKGHPEVSAFWDHPELNVACKCRPDWVSPAGAGVILLDLKTCQDASASGFAKTIANMSYHLQAAHYSDGYALASGLPVLGFVFAAVESTAPHAAAAYMLDDDALTRARSMNAALAATYASCTASGAWPGYSTTVEPISLPPWAF